MTARIAPNQQRCVGDAADVYASRNESAPSIAGPSLAGHWSYGNRPIAAKEQCVRGGDNRASAGGAWGFAMCQLVIIGIDLLVSTV